MTREPLLSVADLDVSYGSVKVVQEVDAAINEGNIVSIIGANGSGKTTLLQTIAGIKRPDSGSIALNGESILDIGPHQIIQRGITYVPERHRIFPNMSVYENLLVATSATEDIDREAAIQEAFDLFPILEERKGQKAGTMSGGQQQMVAIAQGIVVKPELLMLDEPTLGLAPQIVDDVKEFIQSINDQGVTVLVVEEDVDVAMELADRMYLMREQTLRDLGKKGEFESAYEQALEESVR